MTKTLLRRGIARAVLITIVLAWVGSRFLVAVAPADQAAGGEASPDAVWTAIDERAIRPRGERVIVPSGYRTVRLSRAAIDSILQQAPVEFTTDPRTGGATLTLPMPDGTFPRFWIEESPIMAPELTARFPELRTYRGQGIDDPTATARFDLTPDGFHGIILTPGGTVYVDPYAKGDTTSHITYAKADYQRGDRIVCLVGDQPSLDRVPARGPITNGTQLRTYRLALAATGEYAAFHGGTVAGALAAMTTTLNRVNGIYERAVAVRMIMVADNDRIVYLDGATDPYTNGSGIAMLAQNQTNLDAVIGTTNYDIGHVLGTGSGGVASLQSPCDPARKARGVTGSATPQGDPFDVDYVAHEMGHQFGGNHTFNGTTASCGGGNRNSTTAYEPGSGVTIQAYAGICGAENLQSHSIDSFHFESLNEIVAFIDNPSTGGSCPAVSPTARNQLPTANAGADYTIPVGTPFILTASGSDPDADALTYDWQEYDLGTVGPPSTDGGSRPIFRSYSPTTNPSRVLPSLQYIQGNANVPPETYACGAFSCLTGEALPWTTRTLRFQVVVRDNRAGGGAIATDDMRVTVTAGSGPFAVTSPNDTEAFAGLSSEIVSWNVAGTTVAPVSAASVRISLSTDGGVTFPTVLAASTPNDGRESVTLPNVTSTTARVKVEAVGNIFFDMSDANFSIVTVAGGSQTLMTAGAGTGTGTMIVGTEINCTSTAGVLSGDCTAGPFPAGTSFGVAAVPAAGSTFTRWAGCDTVAGNVCTVTMTANRTVTATFTAGGLPPPTGPPAPPVPGQGVQETRSRPLALDGSIASSTVVYDAASGGGTIYRETGAWPATAILTAATHQAWSPGWTIHSGDFNGDGRTDLLFYDFETGAGFKGISDGAFDFSYVATAWSPGWQIAVLDLNGDVLDDLFLYNATTGQYFRATGSGDGTEDFTYAGGFWAPAWLVVPMRLDADSLTDLFIYNTATGEYYRALNNGSDDFTCGGTSCRSAPSQPAPRYSPGWDLTPGFFDADALGDLFFYNITSGEYFVGLNDGGGFTFTGGRFSPGWTVRPGDFSGDGITDLFLYDVATTGHYFVSVSNGAGGFTHAGGTLSPGWETYVTGFNADARADVLFYNAASGAYFQGITTTAGSFGFFGGSFGPGRTIVTNRR